MGERMARGILVLAGGPRDEANFIVVGGEFKRHSVSPIACLWY